MKFRYRNHDDMKESGIEWIGKIPNRWNICKWGYITEVLTDYTANGSFGDLAKNVKYLDYKDYARLVRLVDLREDLTNYGVFVTEKAYKYLSKSCLYGGEFLIANVGANSGLVWQMPKVNYPCTLAPNMMMAKFDKNLIDNNFMIYSANSYGVQNQLIAKATQSSAQPKLNKDDFRTTNFAMPSLEEQQNIVRFLREKTTEFDSLISKKEALIQKLEEAKKSLISEVVTGKVKVVKTTEGYELVDRKKEEMKDSGVEWLGDVPKEWEIKKVKYVASLRSGDSITSEEIENTGEYPVYGGNGLRGYTNRYTHDGEYILIGRQGALCGNINYAKNRFWASEHAVVVNPLGKIDLIWLGELLRAMNLNQYSVSAAQPGLAVGMIENLKIPFTTFEEQKLASIVLKEKITNIEQVVESIKTQIQKLKQAKQSLISEAVTGKIEVLED